MVRVRKFFLNKLSLFYIENFDEKDVPHIFSILLLSFFDYLLFFGVCVWLTSSIEKWIVYGMLVLFPVFNYLIWKSEVKEKKVSLIWFGIYIGISLLSFISSMLYGRYIYTNG
ncbi:MAG: hypothetical protein A3D31_01100 [Candidatus Fluviicola riflensis]|nr:MAG: hypothetical protein CHH17_04440 [Candidatus Fluviicola riflensis]OGS76203.1 MAG: hypothetical protein A3D31_01100 [Candidatus Fluviicola riflensis]OGS83253.1 MAG: hypothetical protein A2724_00740 [Fluviicola sp. RIFCSPHIGHO2_01_FULL_43_53]OGS83735.1 MAG: hypothetical protein A3E30_17705 [Fluviicola sp. RIFCSPHIGHO2_12_FULL_43_24]